MKKFLSVILCMTMLLSCTEAIGFAEDEAYGGYVIESLKSCIVYTTALEDDGYIGIPVGITTYSKGNSTTETPVIFYVVNTNTERVGTDSDEKIITSFLERDYIVIVLDYFNNKKAVSPDLDWSVQAIRNPFAEKAAVKSTYLNGGSCSPWYIYVLPAGYNITRQLNYWSIDKHGTDGIIEYITNVWNNDFLAVRGDSNTITLNGDNMTVREYTENILGGAADDISDCVNSDGSFIDMNLYMDVIYPANPESEVPVLMYAQSSQDTVGTWNNSNRPHMTVLNKTV